MEKTRAAIADLLTESDWTVPNEQRIALDILKDGLLRDWNAWGEHAYFMLNAAPKPLNPTPEYIQKWVNECYFGYYGLKENELQILFTEKYERI